MNESKNNTHNQDALANSERAAQRLTPVTPPSGHKMETTSGVERDLREAETAR